MNLYLRFSLFSFLIVILAAVGLYAQSDTTDPVYANPLERETASLPMPKGLIINASLPFEGFFGTDRLNSGQIKLEPNFLLDAVFYIDSYQIGFRRKQIGYGISLGTRSIKRDIASAFYIEYGITDTYKSRYTVVEYPSKNVVYENQEKMNFYGLGMSLSDFYFRNHDFVYSVDLSIDAIKFDTDYRIASQLLVGSGYRWSAGKMALTPALSLGLGYMPPFGYYGRKYDSLDNVLIVSFNFSMGFSLNL